MLFISFAAILALGLIVFMLKRNMANTGLTTSEKLQAAEESEFTDSDGTSGSRSESSCRTERLQRVRR